MYREIVLTRGMVAKVDESDFEFLNQWKWHAWHCKAAGKWYARRDERRPTRHAILMHRAILGAQPGQLGDHVNGDGLDNRRANLRLSTRSQNRANAGANKNNLMGLKGVTASPEGNRFYARISPRGRTVFLGSFETKEEAQSAYLSAAQKEFGEFAKI